MNPGHVVVRRHAGPFESYWESYTLDGGPEFVISAEFVRPSAVDGATITIGPFRFLVVEFDIDYLAYRVVLDGWRGRLRYALHRATRRLDRCYRRALLVAYALGLSDWHPGRRLTWHDVRSVRKTADWCIWANANCGGRGG